MSPHHATGMPSLAPAFANAAEQEEGFVLAPRFDANGLITAVVTDASSGAVLMLAHMNADALSQSIATGIAHYYSRSRGTLWKKGETSGALQTIREMRVDCDQDAVLLAVDVAKPDDTCHTRRTNCFYRRIVTGSEGALRLETLEDPSVRTRNGPSA